MLTSRPRYKRHQSGGINSSLPVKPSDAIQNSISRAALFPTVQCSAWRAPWGATFEQGGHQQQWSLMTCVSSCMGHTDCLNPPPCSNHLCMSFHWFYLIRWSFILTQFIHFHVIPFSFPLIQLPMSFIWAEVKPIPASAAMQWVITLPPKGAGCHCAY